VENDPGEGRKAKDLEAFDTALLGIAQGCASLPGLSRSGITVAFFLLRHYEKTLALRLSFLMSLPIVLGGNIVLNFGDLTNFSPEKTLALLLAFIFALLTIHFLLKLAENIRFGPLVIVFGLLSITAAFV
jgi:undecaprenyl-diphosphatase